MCFWEDPTASSGKEFGVRRVVQAKGVPWGQTQRYTVWPGQWIGINLMWVGNKKWGCFSLDPEGETPRM